MIWSEEARREIEAAIADRLEDHLSGVTVAVTGESLPGELRAGITLRGLERGAQLAVEARLDRTAAGNEALDEDDAQCLLLDAIDELIFEWIASGQTLRFHGGWRACTFQGHDLSLRAEKTFPELDAAADALLAAADSEDSEA
ncbi:MAG: hypothetical protein LBM75_04115 [Myxococcales bacterium]|jgi:hypothetical protein|nr:hypothetical protein [Myxococcales bacterium]